MIRDLTVTNLILKIDNHFDEWLDFQLNLKM